MNWKCEATEKLRSYAGCRLALDNLPLEIQRLESELARIRSAAADKAMPDEGGEKREDRMLSSIARQAELAGRLSETRLFVETVDRALETLDDEERLILDRLYMHRTIGNFSKLCECLNMEKSSIYRRRDSALRRFTLALYGATETV